VSAPALRKRWWAAEGHGAFAQVHGEDAVQIHVSGVEELAEAAVSYNNIQGWDQAGRLDSLIALERSVFRARSIGDAWAYMLVAEGHLDAAGEWDMKPYDIAALIPIIEEAGGRFTSLEGEAGPWNGSALATNGRLHEAVLETIR
jgi:histidinol-phosphatase